MADGEYFNIGMTVSVLTCHGLTVEGEVSAYDHPMKLLAISILSARRHRFDELIHRK